jgi:hypothetical protein
VAERDPCDDTSVRERHGADARTFATEHLVKLQTNVELWEALYVCPLSGQLWLEDSPRGEALGGGPSRLRVVHEPPGWFSGAVM